MGTEHDRAPELLLDEEVGPKRRCLTTRASGPSDGLIRFVLAPDGAVVPDLKRRLPGRGAWVTARAAEVREAARRNLFARAFRKPAKPAADLAEQVDRLLEARALEALALANKAGRVVAGFAKVEAALATGSVAALIHAAEAAEDGMRKLAAKAPGPVETIRLFGGEQLDLALGRTNVVHAALIAGDISRLALERAAALARYRAGEA